ncbi:MAG TPA: PIN domain nuclease [Candidatus Sulfotelmatobacter sp.]
MIIVDTTVWIDYLRGDENPETHWLDAELQRQRFALVDLILCEVLQGIKNQSTFAQVQADLMRFHIFETGGIDLAVAAARNYKRLREAGYAIRKTIDGLIATFCLRHGHRLLHRDRDFDAFETVLGLSVVHL